MLIFHFLCALVKLGNFLEAHTRIIRFPNFSGAVLEIICRYLYHNHERQIAHPTVPGSSSATARDVLKDFYVAPELMKDTLIAATYLDL